MLIPETIVIDIEGFRFLNEAFTSKELSVRGPDYYDTIFLKPPHPIYLISVTAHKSCSSITNNIHGLSWDSNWRLFFSLFLSKFKNPFPKQQRLRQWKDVCVYETSSAASLIWIILTVPKRPNPAELQFQLSQSLSIFFHKFIAHRRLQTCLISGKVSVSRTLISTAS